MKLKSTIKDIVAQLLTVRFAKYLISFFAKSK